MPDFLISPSTADISVSSRTVEKVTDDTLIFHDKVCGVVVVVVVVIVVF